MRATLALAVVLLGSGCDDSGATAPKDMSVVVAHNDASATADMSPAGATCGKVYDCIFTQASSTATCLAGAPQAAVTAYQAFAKCAATACAIGSDIDPNVPCASTEDLGGEDCHQCVINSYSGPDGPFVDNAGNPIPCMPGTVPECGACAQQANDCISQCFTDADCQGFTMPLTCQSGICQ
jgi:hypothetical protein